MRLLSAKETEEILKQLPRLDIDRLRKIGKDVSLDGGNPFDRAIVKWNVMNMWMKHMTRQARRSGTEI